MCGINGYLNLNGVLDEIDVYRDKLKHRGPDDAGTWVNENRTVALCHRRLAIIDVSTSSHQPFASGDGQCVIVFNGEIYNYLELKAELLELGYEFRSDGDTEVVLNAYRAWGDACVDRFNGMFAFAIYDCGGEHTSERMLLARDRAGKKPLYYRCNGTELEFASELKSISQHDGLDNLALNYYLALGYVPFDLCIAKGVKKLLPGNIATYDPRSGKLVIRQYWQLPNRLAIDEASGEEISEKVWSLLKDSVALRLRSDVPVGVFLSGGLDSSLITAAAAAVSDKPIKTFTVSVPNSSMDESQYAQEIADYFGTDHHVLEMSDTSLSILDEFAPFVDEPLADSSILPTYVVSKLTAEHVKVALGGDGGDELYGGYKSYQAPLIDSLRLGWIPNGILRAVGSTAATLPAGIRGRNRLVSLRNGINNSHIFGTPYFDINLRRRILSSDAVSDLGEDIDLPERTMLNLVTGANDQIELLTKLNFRSVLPDDFLVKVDRASMANSLEVRSPFLDFRCVEQAFSEIPSCWKVNLTERRRIQNLMAKKYLPENYQLDRKQGFSVPMDRWLRQSNYKARLASDNLENINGQEVRNLINGLEKGRANGARIFALLMLSISQRNLGVVT